MRPIVEPFAVKARTGNKASSGASARTGGGGMPGKDSKGRKPPKIGGYEFYKQGAGFACRSVTLENGKRKRRYLGYLSASAWADMQRSHSGPGLREAVREWIETRRQGRE